MADEWLRATSQPVPPVRIDTSAPNVARVWNYLVGGRDNFETDRRAARLLISAAPVMAEVGLASRAFLRRTVTYLAAEAGIRQFLDIGTGMPSGGNTHEVAQAAAPGARIVYVDNDPIVLTHARALLRSAAGGVSFLDADARDTGAVIAGASKTLDLTQPVAVVMIDILNFLPDPLEVMTGLLEQLPSRSYLALMQPTADEPLAAAAERWNRISPVQVYLRDRGAVEGWLARLGLDVIEPGIIELDRWRPAPGDPQYPGGMPLLGAVARKP
jgi:trans-aconitate methyltransferase